MIYKFEIKKILFKKFSLIAILCTLAITGMRFVNGIQNFSWTLENGDSIYGIAAAKELKAAKSQWNGVLDDDKIAMVIETHHKILNQPDYQIPNMGLSDEGYHFTQGYSDITSLIASSFGDFQNYDYYKINELSKEDAPLFYPNRQKDLQNWLEHDMVKNVYSEQEKEYFIDQYNKLNTPLVYVTHDGFDEALRANDYITMFTVVLISILLAPVFSNEIKTGADAIFLSTYHGKNRAIWAKIAAGFTIATVLYFTIHLVVDGLIFLILGTDGGNTLIQTDSAYFKSMFPMTFRSAYLRIMLLGYLACLFITALTLFLSAKIKTSFGTIIITFILLFGPFFLGRANLNYVFLSKLLLYLPHQLLNGVRSLQLFQIYPVGKKIWNIFQMIPALYIPITLVLCPLTYISFKNVKR